MSHDAIHQLLGRLAEALGEGDTATLARCWALPALVLADAGAIAVSDEQQIEKFFTESIAAYNTRGVVATRGELEHVEALAERLMAVDVRWPGLDREGKERSTERSHYIVWIDDDGQARIRVAVSRGAKA